MSFITSINYLSKEIPKNPINYLPVRQRPLPLAGPGLVLALDDHDAPEVLPQLEAVLLQVSLGLVWRGSAFHAHDHLGPLSKEVL